MLTRVKLEAEIAVLTEEVKTVARQRGAALPTAEDLVDLLEVLEPALEAMQAAQEPGEGQNERLAALYAPGEVVPAAEALREVYVEALWAGMAADRPAYQQALRELRPVLRELLLLRAARWSEEWGETSRFHRLYRDATRWLAGAPAGSEPILATCTAESVAQARGWRLVVMAARALHCAVTELQQWREWIAGGAVEQHASLLRETTSPTPASTEDPAARWAREVARHTLPDGEEAELVQRGVVSAEELAAVKALPPIPPGRESAY
jgi:hypothetical protein